MEKAHEICSVEIRRGTIRLKVVEMRMTYGGLIEGVPTATFNDRAIKRAAERASERFMRPVYVVPPEREVQEGPTTGFRGEPVELLPAMECMGFFDGPPTPRAEDDWWTSSLAVVWFQDAGERVVHPDAAARMYELPWDELAQDFTWDDW
ncbi:hypothetical protein [Actinomadura rugatobispora]|uniref:Uncharacterized protein n=1 Tax=Actinomadura rugatobispora TaxID=1994 RepID=A0ABW0ZZN0_9ACTN|nr:hypothetical protein GCM10010200_007810 [Actinomadura rugatobispora]